jgi:hypothetical protein
LWGWLREGSARIAEQKRNAQAERSSPRKKH